MLELYPGAPVFKNSDTPDNYGSVCCFAMRARKLYVLTAAHVAGPLGTRMHYGESGRSRALGKTAFLTTGTTAGAGAAAAQDNPLDAALVSVSYEVARNLEAGNFAARLGGERIAMGVVVPADRDGLHYVVRHAGQKSARTLGSDYANHFGTVNMSAGAAGAAGESRLTMEGRPATHGDSGGPVFTRGGALVAMISGTAGGTDEAPRTRVIHAEAALRALGATLATWDNRAIWMPPERPKPPADLKGEDIFRYATAGGSAIGGKLVEYGE